MSDILIHLPKLEDRILKAPKTEIVASGASPDFLEKSLAGASGHCYYRYGNTRHNGRSHLSISHEKMAVIWKSPLGRTLRPNLLLSGEKGIIVQGVTKWQFFNSEGKELSGRESGLSDFAISPDGTLFGFVDRRGSLCFGDMATGAIIYRNYLPSGDRYSRPFFAFWEKGLFIQGILTKLYPEEIPRDISKFEVLLYPEKLILHDPPDIDPFDARAAGTLYDRSARCATNDENVVIASKNNIYLSNLDLGIEKVLTGEFEPLQISLDTNKNVYLIAIKEEKNWLMGISPAGNLFLEIELPTGHFLPPLIAYDHTIFLVSESKCLKVSKEGKKCWQHAIPSSLGGAVVTAENELVVSAGNILARYDEKGNRHLIFNFAGEDVSTQPVFLKDGTILIATSSHLYKIGPEKQKQ